MESTKHSTPCSPQLQLPTFIVDRHNLQQLLIELKTLHQTLGIIVNLQSFIRQGCYAHHGILHPELCPILLPIRIRHNNSRSKISSNRVLEIEKLLRLSLMKSDHGVALRFRGFGNNRRRPKMSRCKLRRFLTMRMRYQDQGHNLQT